MRTPAVLSILLFTAVALEAQAVAKTEHEKLGAEKFNQAIELYSAGQYEESLPLLRAADSLIGDTELVDRVKLRFALGRACQETGKPEAALSYFEWVAGRDSTYPLIFYQAAESAIAAGKLPRALELYRRSLKSVDDNRQALILGKMARIELDRGRLNEALELVNYAINLVPQGAFFIMRGQIYDRRAQALDHAQDQEFDYEAAIRNSSLTQAEMEQAIELRQQALEDYQRAAEDSSHAAIARRLIERSEVIIENNRHVISEIEYIHANPDDF